MADPCCLGCELREHIDCAVKGFFVQIGTENKGDGISLPPLGRGITLNAEP